MSATTQAAVDRFVTEAKSLGFSWHTRGDVVTINKLFTPGDRDAYVACDGDGPDLLALVPTVKAGSIWGTDGGSIGGHVGLEGGFYTLKVSGASKRFVNALAKVTA